jgi:small subunit ribosomal protein S20
MPITKSAKKALRQNARRKEVNLTYKRKMKSVLKQVRLLATQKKKSEAEKMLPAVYKILDKTAKENIIKTNTASRTKSRITKLVAKIS